MQANAKDDRHARQAHAVTLAFVTLAVCALAHPEWAVADGYAAHEILILVLNGATLCLLAGYSGLAAYRGARRLFQSIPVPYLIWAAPTLLVSFAAYHAVYDSLFYRRFAKLVFLLVKGIPF